MLAGLLRAPSAQQEPRGMAQLTILRLDMLRGCYPLAQSLGFPTPVEVHPGPCAQRVVLQLRRESFGV